MKVLINLSLSVVFGMLIWVIAHSLLLPVTTASDGEGHGPDAGSAEWNHVILIKTQDNQRRALFSGVIAGALALTVLSVVGMRHKTRGRGRQA